MTLTVYVSAGQDPGRARGRLPVSLPVTLHAAGPPPAQAGQPARVARSQPTARACRTECRGAAAGSRCSGSPGPLAAWCQSSAADLDTPNSGQTAEAARGLCGPPGGVKVSDPAIMIAAQAAASVR